MQVIAKLTYSLNIIVSLTFNVVYYILNMIAIRLL